MEDFLIEVSSEAGRKVGGHLHRHREQVKIHLKSFQGQIFIYRILRRKMRKGC